MSFEENLKEYILSRFGTIKDFAIAAELPYGTVDTILRRGIHKASVTNIIQICKTLGISTDELAHDRIVPLDETLRKRPIMTDIDSIISYTKRNIKEYTDLSIDGKKMSKDELEMLIETIEFGVQIIRRTRMKSL